MRSPWLPRVLLVALALGVAAALISLSVRGRGEQTGPVRGIDTIQRIYAGIPQLGARIGREDAEVTLSVFNDLQCEPCAEFHLDTVVPLVEAHARPGEAKHELRHISTGPRETTIAARAATAAGEQGYQWQYADLFMRNLERLEGGKVTAAFLRNVADSIPRLELAEWERDLESDGVANRVQADAELARELGLELVRPSVVVSGPGGTEKLTDAPSLQEVEAAVERLR